MDTLLTEELGLPLWSGIETLAIGGAAAVVAYVAGALLEKLLV